MAPADPHSVRITSRERVVFPDAGFTKGDLADYYAALGPAMLPALAGRPLSLVRCPQGIGEHCFFQKHHTAGLGPDILSVEIAEKDGEVEPYLYVDSAAGILECVQLGTVEFHLWASHAARLEAPDRLVFDLDPDEGLGFAETRRAAGDLRAVLEEQGLASFAMLTGGKGVHVVVPLAPGHSWDAHRGFARTVAESLAQAEPDRFTATMSKEKRKGRIFIDWLRNARGGTAIAPWSVRARPGAPVAVPVGWDELEGFADAHPFSLRDAAELIARASHLEGWGASRQKLPGAS